jgi:nucleotide-binding universal stress UspA family protein
MFHNVIVGVGDDAAGRDALALAEQLASPGRRLTLASVEVVVAQPPPASRPVSVAGDRRLAMGRLEALRDESHVEARVLYVEAGSVASGLEQIAVRHDGDLLVIGASRRDEYERQFVGDDARAVLKRAPCAVAVAPIGYAVRREALKKIGVGYDGSPQSQQALEVALKLATEQRAELSAFEAVREPVFLNDPWHPEAEVDAYVADRRRRIAELGDVEAHAAAGDTAEELARYGASVDLLVVGPHKSGPADQVMSGTTAQRLADSAPCPLLVLSSRA